MPQSVMHTVLVIGNFQEDKIAKYSADIDVEPWVKYQYKNASAYHKARLSFLKALLETDAIKLTEMQREQYKKIYLDYANMTDEEFYFNVLGEFNDFDDETNDIITTENPDAKFMYAKCYDERIRTTGEEAPFSTPFVLKDGTKAYSALKKDIDWNKVHMANTDIYEAAWELCVENREPVNETEQTIKTNMKNRELYFAKFDDKESYVNYSCSFWCYGVITNDSLYYELDYTVRDKDWIENFYDKFIKDLPEDTLLSIYEVRNIG